MGIRYLRHGEAKEKPIGKGFDKIPQRQQRPRERRANEQEQIPFPTGSINPKKSQRRARDKGTTENHSQQREGRARRAARGRAIACDERRCADALNRLAIADTLD